MENLLCYVLYLSSIATKISSYKTYSALDTIVFTKLPEPEDGVHSEYYYGKCATEHKRLAVHDHITYEDLKGKLVIKGYMNPPKDFTCIYVRSTSPVPDMVKYKRTGFTMCLSKIRYQYAGRQLHIHFYEWFLPAFMKPNINWDIFIYY